MCPVKHSPSGQRDLEQVFGLLSSLRRTQRWMSAATHLHLGDNRNCALCCSCAAVGRRGMSIPSARAVLLCSRQAQNMAAYIYYCMMLGASCVLKYTNLCSCAWCCAQIIVANASVTFTNPSTVSCREHMQRGLFTFQQVRHRCQLMLHAVLQLACN